jgi:hypothetical protein
MTAVKNELFDRVCSRWYAKSYLERVTERPWGQKAVQYGTRTNKKSSIVLNEYQYRMRTTQGMTEEDRYGDTVEDRIPQRKGLLRTIQEQEHRTERTKFLVYVV